MLKKHERAWRQITKKKTYFNGDRRKSGSDSENNFSSSALFFGCRSAEECEDGGGLWNVDARLLQRNQGEMLRLGKIPLGYAASETVPFAILLVMVAGLSR